MENSHRLKGQKFERNLSFHEVAKILGTSNVKLLGLLRKKEIIFKTNNRNLPYDKFLTKKWFEVSYSEIDNSGFSGLVPIVKITKNGFDEIEKLLIDNDSFIKHHNQRTFFKTIFSKISKRLNDLNIEFKDIKDWLSKNTVTHYDKDTATIFTFVESKRTDLISYNLKKKIIIENERK